MILKQIFIFGNGNLSFDDFITHYQQPLSNLVKEKNVVFIVCDFRGLDTLVMEFLKTTTPNVLVYHMGEKPRYKPDAYKTQVGEWLFVGGFDSDAARDNAAIKQCTHFLAIDFNSDSQRKSGTLKNIEKCLKFNKLKIIE